jgi:hypothetical protein
MVVEEEDARDVLHRVARLKSVSFSKELHRPSQNRARTKRWAVPPTDAKVKQRHVVAALLRALTNYRAVSLLVPIQILTEDKCRAGVLQQESDAASQAFEALLVVEQQLLQSWLELLESLGLPEKC